MNRTLRVAGMVVLLCGFVAACSETGNPIAPLDNRAPVQPSFLSAAAAAAGRHITILDECDPGSFNDAIGPGTCVGRNGGLTFAMFLSILRTNQRVPAWRFSPDTIHVPTDMTLPIVNAGGEVHTFTEVEDFGGGIVPILNQLSGLTTVAPECLAGLERIQPGAQTTHSFEAGEVEKYQCCIHPWMRAITR